MHFTRAQQRSVCREEKGDEEREQMRNTAVQSVKQGPSRCRSRTWHRRCAAPHCTLHTATHLLTPAPNRNSNSKKTSSQKHYSGEVSPCARYWDGLPPRHCMKVVHSHHSMEAEEAPTPTCRWLSPLLPHPQNAPPASALAHCRCRSTQAKRPPTERGTLTPNKTCAAAPRSASRQCLGRTVEHTPRATARSQGASH